MSAPPIYLTNTRTILFKIETTAGTDASPAGSTDAVLSFSGKVTIDADQFERKPDRTFFGGNPFVLLNKRATAEFEIEMMGNGTSGTSAPIAPVLKAAAHAEVLAASIAAPVTSACSTSTTGGTLAAATYYYKVTAINANGETIPGTEQNQATTGSTSTVTVNWATVTGATGYKIYRGTAAGAEGFLASVGVVTSYVDTGSATPTTATPPTVNGTGAATYNPVSTGFQTATIYFYQGGLLFKLTYCVGTIDWDLTIGNRWIGKCKFTGIIDLSANPSEAVPSGVNVTAFQTPTPADFGPMLLTIGGTTVNAHSVQLTQGNDVKLFVGSEAKQISVVKRETKGKLIVFRDAIATINPWSIANAQSTNNVIATMNAGGGKTAVLSIPTAQFAQAQISDLQGAVAWEIPFTALPLVGGDEYNFRFS